MINKRVKNAYLFDNGNLAALDLSGQQIPELQGAYSIEKHKRIVLESLDDCKFNGFEILPKGFNKHVYDFVNYFRKQEMSWEEICAV